MSDLDSNGHLFGPDAIEHAMRQNDYHSFFRELEDGPHLAIPQGVGGDFFYTVAPYGEFTSLTESMQCLQHALIDED